jgi:hypothetical protein
MALARIITRSQACSRQLALDLLARGYAVEIVSPDQIPDNIADLELRVDTLPGDQLVANVRAHDGERSASLEFVHHLKAPMVDFMRRPPGSLEAPRFREQPVTSSAEPGIEAVNSPADPPQSAVNKVSPKAEAPLRSPLDRDLNSEPNRNPNPDPNLPEEGTRLISPPVPSTSPMEPPGYFAVKNAAITPATTVSPVIVPPEESKQHRDHSPEWSAGWRLRTTLTFAGIVLLAVVVAFGVRRAGKAAEQSPETLNAEKVAAASADVNPLDVNPAHTNPAANPNPTTAADSATSPAGPGSLSSATAPPAVANSEGNSGRAPQGAQNDAQIAKVAGPAAIAHARVSHKDERDLIARDTVTYLDKHFEPASKAKQKTARSRQHSKPRPHNGGVIAANSVTYLNKKPTPKVAK